MKKVVILGATGSVGASVLSVIRDYPSLFAVTGLAARSGSAKLAGLCREFPGAAVAYHNAEDETQFNQLLGGEKRTQFIGKDAGEKLVETVEADICVAAVSGCDGLTMTFAAARRGLRILLADKELLVSAGRLFLDEVKRGGAEILPLDSEHCALFQCLENRRPDSVEKLIIIASGGPFRKWSARSMAKALPQQALRHPVWNMGSKISIDSATLANKALEVIEARHLFGIPFEKIEVLVHPESIVHGLVEFVDGSLLAQLSVADMKSPASFGLFYPEREKTAKRRLNLAEIGQLNFEYPDTERFPMLGIGIEAGKNGEIQAATFNAANEAAVTLYLHGEIAFADIVHCVQTALGAAGTGDFTNLEQVFLAHRQAAQQVKDYANNLQNRR